MRVNSARRSRNRMLREFAMPEDRRWTLFKRVWGLAGRVESVFLYAVLMGFASLPMLGLPIRLTCFVVASVLLVLMFTWQIQILWIRNLRHDHPIAVALGVFVSCGFVISHVILARMLVFGS